MPRDGVPRYPKRMTKRSPCRYFKTSPEIIRLALMLEIRFPLSLGNSEVLSPLRGICFRHETVRYWKRRGTGGKG